MELLHASQVEDLHKTQQTNVKLSDKTQALYDSYRAKVEDLRKPLQTNGKLSGNPWRFTTPTVPRFPSSRRIASSRGTSPTAWNT